ncbi:MAG: SPL family radical SAM protein [Myxococcaceae bacterium]
MQPGTSIPGIKSWPADGRGVEYVPLKSTRLFRQAVEPGKPWFWSLNPYRGCELGCTFCSVRLDRREFDGWSEFQKKVEVKTDAAERIAQELQSEEFRGRPVVLGTKTEPWQPAEEHVRVTRGVLEALSHVSGLDLRVMTRSSLIARDTDLLKKISDKGRVTVTFSLASLDERVNRLMEPKAPSAFRRLAALEALAMAGVNVGLMVSPVLPGLDEEELGLEALLRRASNAGARFAGMEFLKFDIGQRETFFNHVTRLYPELAMRFRRVVGVRPPTEADQAELAATFNRRCEELGLLPLWKAMQPPPAPKQNEVKEVKQLGLFG